MRTPIRTVLFDVDGTLLDTREFILQAYAHTLAWAGAPRPADDALVAQIGRPLERIYAELAAGAGRPAGDLVEEHRRFQTGHLDLAAPIPGVHAVLDQLVSAGMTLAAVTSRSRRSSVATLELTGVAPYLRAVVSAEDVAELKPDPAPLRLALSLLGVTADGAAMVGDTHHDILAGRALDLLTIGVTYGFGGEALLRSAPDRCCAEVAEIPAALGPLRTRSRTAVARLSGKA
jgi:HAD superfamily hydrolase (TIGR01509 family)